MEYLPVISMVFLCELCGHALIETVTLMYTSSSRRRFGWQKRKMLDVCVREDADLEVYGIADRIGVGKAIMKRDVADLYQAGTLSERIRVSHERGEEKCIDRGSSCP